jgi:hypothetical protein
MSKPSGYTSYSRDEVPFEGSPGILKKKKALPPYEPEEFLPKLATPKAEINPMP